MYTAAQVLKANQNTCTPLFEKFFLEQASTYQYIASRTEDANQAKAILETAEAYQALAARCKAQ